MTEQELREKIVDVIIANEHKGEKNIRGETIKKYLRIADSLIAAEIGDVSEWKHKVKVAERVIANILCADACYFCNEKHGDCNVQHHDYGSKECIDRLLRLAEKELQEEKEDE